MRGATEYRGVEQLEARRAHNPEVVGSSPASATIKNIRFHKKTDVFLTFWWLQKLQTLRLGGYLGFTPVVDSVFLTFWPKMIFGVKQHFWEKVPESFIQNVKYHFHYTILWNTLNILGFLISLNDGISGLDRNEITQVPSNLSSYQRLR